VSALVRGNVPVCTWAMTSTQREKAWKWARALLGVAAEDGGVSYDTLAAVVADAGRFDDPYEVVNDWSKDGRLVDISGEHRLRSRRYRLADSE
jgi:hypothetical protein